MFDLDVEKVLVSKLARDFGGVPPFLCFECSIRGLAREKEGVASAWDKERNRACG